MAWEKLKKLAALCFPSVSLIIIGMAWAGYMLSVNAWANLVPIIVVAAGAGIGVLTFSFPSSVRVGVAWALWLAVLLWLVWLIEVY